MYSINAGIKNESPKKWQKVNESLYIDTKEFNIDPPLMFFWVRNPNYDMRRLTINCSTLEEMERYKTEVTEWGPIFSNDIKYEIVDQLCFLTNNDNFRRERRPPKWARQIIDKQNVKLENFKKGELLKEKKVQNFVE